MQNNVVWGRRWTREMEQNWGGTLVINTREDVEHILGWSLLNCDFDFSFPPYLYPWLLLYFSISRYNSTVWVLTLLSESVIEFQFLISISEEFAYLLHYNSWFKTKCKVKMSTGCSSLRLEFSSLQLDASFFQALLSIICVNQLLITYIKSVTMTSIM